MENKSIIQIVKAGQMASIGVSLFGAFHIMLESERIFQELKLCARFQGFNEQEIQEILKKQLNKLTEK